MVATLMSRPRKPQATPRLRQFDANIAKASGRMAERVREPVPFCWFCPSTEGRKTREHIFPKWLSGHYGARAEVVTPFRMSAATGMELSRRPEKPLSSFVCGDVCADCNNGWMSQAEEDVRPLLTTTKRRGRLSTDEAFNLARWFAKTAAVINVSQPYRLLFPERDRHALRLGIPDRLTVSLFKSRRQNGLVDWLQGGFSTALTGPGISPEAAGTLMERTLITHIRVADLVGVVVLVPPPLTTAAVVEQTDSTRIWPLPAKLPTWGSRKSRKDYIDHLTVFDISNLPFGI